MHDFHVLNVLAVPSLTSSSTVHDRIPRADAVSCSAELSALKLWFQIKNYSRRSSLWHATWQI
jgi:hypothetical protein